MPREAQELSEKLSSWQAEARATLDKEIQDKTAQVIAALNSHLTQATKAGDLEGAIAIRNYITELQSRTRIAETPNEGEESHAPSAATKPLEKRKETWTGKHPKTGIEIELESRGDGTFNWKFSDSWTGHWTFRRHENGEYHLWEVNGSVKEDAPWLAVFTSETEGTVYMGTKGRNSAPVTITRSRK
jgi:hypothetical protein